MAITHMRISTLPERVDLEKDSSPAVENESFVVSEQNELKIMNNSGFKAERLDKFGYQVSTDNVNWSNEAFCTINDLVSENTPESSNVSEDATENDIVNFAAPTPMLPINGSTDRVKIVGINKPYGRFKHSALDINIGQEFFNYQFANLQFTTGLGAGEPYQEIEYICGNHLGYNEATVYTVEINVPLTAELEFIDRNTLTYDTNISSVDYPTIETIDTIKVKKGYIEKLAGINFIIDSPMFSDSIYNKILIDDLEKTADEDFDLAFFIDTNGEVFINIRHIFIDINGTTTSSKIDLLLETIDGDSGKVSATNSYTSLVNYND